MAPDNDRAVRPSFHVPTKKLRPVGGMEPDVLKWKPARRAPVLIMPALRMKYEELVEDISVSHGSQRAINLIEESVHLSAVRHLSEHRGPFCSGTWQRSMILGILRLGCSASNEDILEYARICTVFSISDHLRRPGHRRGAGRLNDLRSAGRTGLDRARSGKGFASSISYWGVVAASIRTHASPVGRAVGCRKDRDRQVRRRTRLPSVRPVANVPFR